MFARSARLQSWLAAANPAALNLFAVAAAFATYFCMYAFRKPFAAGTYQGLSWNLGGAEVELKTALVISQIIGYATSKFVGIKVCSEASRGRRAMLLILLILAAEAALVAFAAVPKAWKPATLFFNGLPLGMVWGLVVQYLEGRRTSEFLLAGLSCSYILSSGVVKDVGRALMAEPANRPSTWLGGLPAVQEFWMPAATGALFFPAFLAAVWLLDHLPEPTREDVAERTERVPMDAAARRRFFKQFMPGIVLLLTSYFLLTAFRDFRDNYMVDVLQQMGYSYDKFGSLLSQMELGVALVVLTTMALLSLVRDNQRGLQAVFAVMIAGLLLLGGATWLLQAGLLSGFWWMTLLGTGSYLAYVPYNSLLCDRLLASTRSVGTAVFIIYVADAVGYVGSVLIQLFKDLAFGDVSRLAFMTNLSYLACGGGAIALAGAAVYFFQFARHGESRSSSSAVPADAGATRFEFEPER